MEKHVYSGALLGTLKAIESSYGSQGLVTLMDKLEKKGYAGPRTVKEVKNLKVEYPVEDAISLSEAIVEEYGEAKFKRIAKKSAKVKGVIGFLLRFSSQPEILLSKAGKYWPDFYDFGKLEGELLEPRKGRVRGYDINLPEIFCRNLGYYYEGVLEENVKGIKNIKIKHTKCSKDSDLEEWILTWK